MSDIKIGATEQTSAFPPRTIALMVMIGIIGFIATLVLGAYAPDFRNSRNGGGHALSNAAIGFGGLVRLAEATGRNPQIVRDVHQWRSEDLLVATPASGFVDINDLMQARTGKPTLLILPKWSTIADPDHLGWVREQSLLPPSNPGSIFSPGLTYHIGRHPGRGFALVTSADLPATIRFTAARPLQVITGASGGPPQAGRPQEPPTPLHPLITDGAGGIVLGRVGDDPLFVLADPDLLDNAGMKDIRQADAAMSLLDWMNSTGATTIGFDVTLNGLGRGRNPLKLAFDPPFLAMTLALAAVVLLVCLHALGRFGAPRPRQRAIAFGKTALVDNSAALIRKAGRAHELGDRYAAAIRDQAVRMFSVPARLKGGEIDAYLDGLAGRSRFTELTAAAMAADDDSGLLAAAQALHEWQQEKLA
jgi:hypothetical protein